MTTTRLIKIISMAILLGVAIPAFAESAPVYDADQMPPDDGYQDSQQRDVLPPAPPQEGAFIPGGQGAPSVPSATVGSSSTASMSMEQRMKRMEQQLTNMTESNSTSHIESLQTQIQSLRDQVEQLTHKLEQMQAEQKTIYTDLDKRITDNAYKPAVGKEFVADEATKAAPQEAAPKKPAKVASVKVDKKPEAPKTAAAADTQPDVAEEQQIYQTAYNLIKDKKYSDAVIALQNMLKKYPSGQFASNAHYWLGELYGLLGNHDKSLVEFNTVVSNYSTSPRVSDAQLKVGLILASQSKWTEAKASFKKIINTYPGTASARLASEQLKQIKKAGH